MQNRLFSPRFILITSAILVAAATRLLPHPPNFTPITAIALFGGAYFGSRVMALIIPLVAMMISDLLLVTFVYPEITSVSTYFVRWETLLIYFSFGLIVLFGFMLRTRKRVVPVMIATLSATLLFFILSNFGVWMSGIMYPMNAFGLVACYTAAVPYLNNMLLGDLLFTGALFGGFYLLSLKFPALAKINS